MGTNSKLCRTSKRRSYSRITIIHLTRPRTDRRRRYSRRQAKTKRSAVKPPSKWRRSVRVPWHSPRSLLLPRGANHLPISHKPTIHKPSAPLFWISLLLSHFLILPLPHFIVNTLHSYLSFQNAGCGRAEELQIRIERAFPEEIPVRLFQIEDRTKSRI